MAIADSKYMALTTFRKSGEAVTSPVWVVPLDDGRIGFWTSSTSGKVKRLRHTARVVVQPSNGRGKPLDGSSPVEGTAELSMPPLPEVVSKVKAKYGWMTTASKVVAKIAHPIHTAPYGDVSVAVSLAGDAG